MITKLNENISRKGWAELSTSLSGDSLVSRMLEVAASLADPTSRRDTRPLERLSPTHAENAKPNSLSRQYGLGAFPFHTDYAHLLVPPRLIILGCSNPGHSPCPTVLAAFRNIRFNEFDLEACRTGTFLVKNGRRSFYSTVLDRSRPFVRFDRDCMRPVCSVAESVAERVAVLLDSTEPTTIHWEAGKILILNNWHVLHGRAVSRIGASPDRRLFRICIQ